MTKKISTTVKEFMDAWKSEDWQTAATLTQLTWNDFYNKKGVLKKILQENNIADTPVETLQNYLSPFKLVNYHIMSYSKITSVICDVSTEIEIKMQTDNIEHYTVVIRLICEDGPMKPSPTGTWGVNPLSLLWNQNVRVVCHNLHSKEH